MSVGPRILKSPHKPLVALTGATGFIGRYLLQELPKRGYRLRVLLRRAETLPQGCAGAVIGDLARPYNMSEALAGVDAIIHTAGLAATMTGVPEDDYRLFNTEATVGFAKAAQRAKIKRFVFLSSIRAQSGPTAQDILTEEHEPRPTDAYGRSKLEGERLLAQSGVPFTVLRPAVVYGKGVKGNIAALATLARTPMPLPFAGLDNRRSLLARDNLVSAIALALGAREALNETFLVADAEPISVADLVAAMREGLGRAPHLVKMPLGAIKRLMGSFGREADWERISGAFLIDASKLMRIGWRPSIATRAGIIAMMGSGNGAGA